MDSLITYANGTDQPGITIPTANGFVSRVVSAVVDQNLIDGIRVAKILNEYFKCEVCGERPGHQDDEALFWLSEAKAPIVCRECRIDAGEIQMAGAA
jgi:hypothetical protein